MGLKEERDQALYELGQLAAKLAMQNIRTDQPGLTEEDGELLAAIAESAGDIVMTSRLMHHYYMDADRADRTPRQLLYLHLGILMGAQMECACRSCGHPASEHDNHGGCKLCQRLNCWS